MSTMIAMTIAYFIARRVRFAGSRMMITMRVEMHSAATVNEVGIFSITFFA